MTRIPIHAWDNCANSMVWTKETEGPATEAGDNCDRCRSDPQFKATAKLGSFLEAAQV